MAAFAHLGSACVSLSAPCKHLHDLSCCFLLGCFYGEAVLQGCCLLHHTVLSANTTVLRSSYVSRGHLAQEDALRMQDVGTARGIGCRPCRLDCCCSAARDCRRLSTAAMPLCFETIFWLLHMQPCAASDWILEPTRPARGLPLHLPKLFKKYTKCQPSYQTQQQPGRPCCACCQLLLSCSCPRKPWP